MSLRPSQLLIVILGLATSTLAWLSCRPWHIDAWMIGAPFGRDFVNFWMAPRLVLAGKAATLVDLPAYAEAIKGAFAMKREPNLLFVYPPHLLPLVLPCAVLPFALAVTLWSGLNLAALAVTTHLIRPSSSKALLVAVCVSPPALTMVLYGHFGGLLALASTLALMESERRPWLSGAALAVLTVKPQYAAALGLILLCAGRWRCLLAAGFATAALVAVSVGAFGLGVWRDFITITMPMQSAIISTFQARLIETSVSAYFAARFWGAPAAAAWAIQGAVAAGALAVGAQALRRPSRGVSDLFAALLAAFVMQPYASHYDLAIVAPALTIMLLERGARPSAMLAIVWVLIPLARILFAMEAPVLAVLVPASLFAQIVGVGGPTAWLRAKRRLTGPVASVHRISTREA